MALRVSRGLRASAEGLIWSSGVVGVGMRRLCSAKDNTRRGQQSFVEADKQQDNQLDKFAYAIESHPVHEGIVNITGEWCGAHLFGLCSRYIGGRVGGRVVPSG